MRKKLELSQISVFCYSIGMMLNAGVSVSEACGIYAEDGDSEIADAAKQISEHMENGESFARAAELSGAFPAYALGVFRMAEYAGRLDDALERLAEYFERQEALNRRLRNTLIYPVVLMLMMCCVLAVLVFAVLPMFEKVYGSLTGGILVSSYAYVVAAAWIGRVGLAAAGLVSAVLLCLASCMSWEKGRDWLNRRMETFRLTKKASWMLAVSKLADILSTLLASGTDSNSAMDLAIDLTDHSILRKTLEQCREKMRRGESLGTSLFRAGVFPALYGRMLASGNETGNLSDTLERLSDRMGKDAEAALIGIIDAMEPVLIGFLTVAVGLTLLSVMLPLLGILGSV